MVKIIIQSFNGAIIEEHLYNNTCDDQRIREEITKLKEKYTGPGANFRVDKEIELSLFRKDFLTLQSLVKSRFTEGFEDLSEVEYFLSLHKSLQAAIEKSYSLETAILEG